MLRFATLASSSKGNASVICSESTTLMVDAGISCLRIRKGLEQLGLHTKQLNGILFTHEHGDHCNGLGQLAKREQLQIYCTRHTASDLRAKAPSANFCYIEPSLSCMIGDINVTCFTSSHDACDPVGYLFESGGVRFGYLTDTGRILAEMRRLLKGIDGIYLESNYDPNCLQNSQRDYRLIQRIASNWGHLSNQQAADFIREIADDKMQHIILGHLSQDCNRPELALACMQGAITELELSSQLQCAPTAHPMPWLNIKP